MRSLSRVVLAAFLTLSSGIALTAQAPQKSTAPRPSYRSAPGPDTPLGLAWQQFLTADLGGTWWSRWSPATGTPREIWGSGIALSDWRGDNQLEARRQAQMFLNEHKELLALGTSEFREQIGARMGETWVFVYQQYFRGIPAVGGRADVRVHAVGRVPMFGSTAWQIPADFLVVPQLDELEATRLAWTSLGVTASNAKQPGKPRAPRLVIWGDLLARERQTPRLCWEIPISNIDANGDGLLGRSYVDAASGAVLHYESDKHECGFTHSHADEHETEGSLAAMPQGQGQGQGQNPGKPSQSSSLIASYTSTGRVMAQTRAGLAADSALVTIPVAGARVTTGLYSTTTDAGGYYSITWLGFGTSISAAFMLDGQHSNPMSGTNSPATSRTLVPGLNPDVTLTAPSDLEAAHTSTYYWIYEVNEWARSILGNSAELNTADSVAPTVNIANTCNAWYSGNTVNFYQAGGNCRNTAFATIITHEWGHGLDDRYGGISNSLGDGLSEGWGDIVGMYQSDSAVIGPGFYTNGGSLRTGNNARAYPPNNEVHQAGEVWMGFAWQLREHVAALRGRSAAIALTNRIVLGSIVADAVDQLGAYLQVYVADDNDGNLANLTPNTTEIKWAGDAKSYPYPLAAAPTNDECSGAIRVYNSTYSGYNNSTALDSDPSWYCSSFGSKDLWFKYLAGTGPLTVSTCTFATFDTVIQIFSGSCGALTNVACNDDSCGTFQSSVTANITTPGWYYIRIGGYNNESGTFGFSVSGTAGNLASTSTFGKGCPNVSRTFYEFSSAAAFDLNGSAIRFTPQGLNYRVTSVAPTGIYRSPGLATPLVLGDDDDALVTLPSTLTFPGGSTSVLLICSNGFVSAATGNGTYFSPSGTGWAASPHARWGTWHDFNPSAAGSGSVRYEVVGSIAYVTWDGVYDFGSTNRNTWQIQFNCSTGVVTMVWPLMSGGGSNVLVGFTPPGPNPDAGSIDLSATVPFNASTSTVWPMALAATPPVIGQPWTLTTTEFPSTTTFGAILESFVVVNPGTDLTALGFGGCFAFVGQPNISILQFPAGGQSILTQNTPNAPSFMGIRLGAQTFAFASGFNAGGMVSSNGVTVTVGF